MDLTKKEVCDFIYSTLDNAISSYNLDYIKWDYNRPMSSIKSNRSLFFYNYIKGLYSILERIKEKYPTYEDIYKYIEDLNKRMRENPVVTLGWMK